MEVKGEDVVVDMLETTEPTQEEDMEADDPSIPWSAIFQLRFGGPLLKFGRKGSPHFRNFKLSEDCRYLTWSSNKKAATEAKVCLADCVLLQGQQTDVFRKNDRSDLLKVSFSLDSGVKTLDVTCADAQEYDAWVTALLYLTTNEPPSAAALMRRSSAHSGESKKTGKHRMNDANDVYSWGAGGWGQLGVGSDKPRPVPSLVEALLGKGIRQLACGAEHTLAVSDTGELYAWGSYLNGRLGIAGAREHVLTPELVLRDGGSRQPWTFDSVACGDFHNVAIAPGGTVMVWGMGACGQLGLDHTRDVATPTLLPGVTQARNVGAGHSASAAVTTRGELFTWGSNECGELGVGDTTDRLQPTLVEAEALQGEKALEVTCGDFHMALITESHKLFTWGWGSCGQLGLGDTSDRHTPCLVEAFADRPIVTANAGSAHMTAVAELPGLKTRTVFTWGACSRGQTGHPHLQGTALLNPRPLQGLDAIEFVACGADHCVALTEEGNVYTWGCWQPSAPATGGSAGAGASRGGATATATASASSSSSASASGAAAAVVPTPQLVAQLSDKMVRSVQCGGRHTAACVAREWISDSATANCMQCKDPFTFTNRRHHCRNCGGIYCGSCTSRKMAVLKLGHIRPVRVCDSCFAKAARG